MATLPSSVTAPSVVEFVTGWGLTGAPALISYTDHGYGPDWCHVSSKAHALKYKGRRVHGWALWEFGDGGATGNFHSVWEDASGLLVDLTPPKYGSGETLFVRDPTVKIVANLGFFEMPHNRLAIGPQQILLDPFTGDIAQSPHWQLTASNPAFAAYCALHELPISKFATDPAQG